MGNLLAVAVLVALLALWLAGIVPPYLFPVVALLVAPGPFRRFVTSTARRLWVKATRQ